MLAGAATEEAAAPEAAAGATEELTALAVLHFPCWQYIDCCVVPI